MNQELAQMFGTDKIAAAAQENLEVSKDNFIKVASALQMNLPALGEEGTGALFYAWQEYEKQASDQGIDLGQYSLPGVAQGFSNWYNEQTGSTKEAEQAQQISMAESFISKIAAETTVAEDALKIASFIGRAAAHAQMAEMAKLAEGTPTMRDPKGGYSPAENTARALGYNAPTGGVSPRSTGARAGGGSPERAGTPAAAAPGGEAKVKPLSQQGKGWTVGDTDKVPSARGRADALKDRVDSLGKDVAEKAKKLWGHEHRNKALIGAGTAAALTLGAVAAKKIHDKYKENGGEEKKAFDKTAGELALYTLVEAGFDVKEAAERLNHALAASFYEPVSDDVKVASAEGGEMAVQARAIELMELAGYEVLSELSMPNLASTAPSSLQALATPAKAKPPAIKLPGVAKSTDMAGGASISQVTSNPAITPQVPEPPLGGGAPAGAKTAAHQGSPMNIQHLIHQALQEGVSFEKRAAADCDDDDKDEKKDEKKEKAEGKSEVKEAADRALQLSALTLKVASQMGAEIPNSDVSTVPDKKPASSYGAGTQQHKVLTAPPAGRDLPTTHVGEPGATGESKLASLGRWLLKSANESAASIPTKDVSQGGASGPSVIGSNQSLINMTPAQARDASNKRKDLAEHFEEPALTSSTDSALTAAFTHTEGNKLATARELFQRLKQEASR